MAFGPDPAERHPVMPITALRRWIRRITGSPPHALASPEKRPQVYKRLDGLPFPDKLPRHEIAPDEEPRQRHDDEEG